MRSEVYADVVFLINFAMDFLILYGAGKLADRKVRRWRIAGGALYAALAYCALIFVPALNGAYNLVTAAFILITAVCACYCPMRLAELAKVTGLALVMAFAVGGGGMALFYLTNIGVFVGKNVLFLTAEHFSVKILISASCISYGVLKLAQRYLDKVRLRKQRVYTVEVFLPSGSAELRALVDTGNTLSDPITKTPVLIAEYKALVDCLPDYVRKLYDENKEDDLESILALTSNTPFAGRLRLIPFHSVGREGGVLFGFRPDKIKIYVNDEICEKAAVVGIYNTKLSNDEGYNALLNPALIDI